MPLPAPPGCRPSKNLHTSSGELKTESRLPKPLRSARSETPPSCRHPRADEVAAGEITHALRLALPNEMLQHGVFAHPATHASSVLRGNAHSPFYGMRMRLKRTFEPSSFPNPTKANMTSLAVIFKALQKYGMFEL